jgi:long-chain acyl-CoA synthetase
MSLSIAEATAQLIAPGQMWEVSEELVEGRPTKVWKNCPPSLRSLLELSRAYGDRTFLVYEDDRLSFAEHFQMAASFARCLTENFGVRVGDRVAIAMRNFPEWVIAFWGAAAVGAVIVPLNAWWTGPELAYGLSDSGSTVAVLDAERLERLSGELADLRAGGLERCLVARAGEEERFETAASLVRGGDVEEFESVLASYAEADPSLPPSDVGPDDDATIFYTSGTTGKPKGALGTQRNICTNLMSLGFVNARGRLTSSPEHLERTAVGDEQTAYLLSVPLFHATGCHAILVPNTTVGGKLVMMRRFNAERALELIERERITIFGGVPTMAWQVVESPDFDKRDTSSVRAVAYGGAPAPPELLRKIREHFPAGSASNGYGLTETSSVTSLNSGEDYFRKPDSVGPPVPVVEVRIVGPEGEDVPLGETGELWIKGPNVVRGYWNKAEATAASFTDGWLRSGDIARLDDEGFIYIVDRAKDMVIRGGENVYSAEVEAAIFEHPAVADTAVIGVPHDVLGEEVGAVVVLKPGSELTAEELRAHVAARIAAFKVPAHVFFYERELPRNPAGKVLKRELRSEVLA